MPSNPDANPLLQNVVLAVPFFAYFTGIVIRKIVLPGKNSPPLSHQLLLGIPMVLVIVAPLLQLLNHAWDSQEIGTFLLGVGIIMEHGMLVNETATSHICKLRNDLHAGRRSLETVKRISEKPATIVEPTNSTMMKAAIPSASRSLICAPVKRSRNV
jgi:hypothetical protein